MKLYMWVDTSNEYELPLAVAKDVPELARMVGVNPNAIYCYISHSIKENYKKRKFIVVELDEEQEGINDGFIY